MRGFSLIIYIFCNPLLIKSYFRFYYSYKYFPYCQVTVCWVLKSCYFGTFKRGNSVFRKNNFSWAWQYMPIMQAFRSLRLRIVSSWPHRESEASLGYVVRPCLTNTVRAGCRWFRPVILVTQETEIRRIVVQSQPG
jgi:hypothetical protein